jgi:hypothetical protein
LWPANCNRLFLNLFDYRFLISSGAEALIVMTSGVVFILFFGVFFSNINKHSWKAPLCTPAAPLAANSRQAWIKKFLGI